MKANSPRILLHLEGLVVVFASLTAFYVIQGNWKFYFLVLIPDLGMIGYLVSKKFGSISYNMLHTYIFPIILLFLGIFYNYSSIIQIALVWISHIGIDRAIGYGLKYPSGFKDTHLQRL